MKTTQFFAKLKAISNIIIGRPVAYRIMADKSLAMYVPCKNVVIMDCIFGMDFFGGKRIKKHPKNYISIAIASDIHREEKIHA